MLFRFIYGRVKRKLRIENNIPHTFIQTCYSNYVFNSICFMTNYDIGYGTDNDLINGS